MSALEGTTAEEREMALYNLANTAQGPEQPTTEQVEAVYGTDYYAVTVADRSTVAERVAAFRAWLAAHDAGLLRTAAQHIEEQWSPDLNGTLRSGQWVDEYLTSEADRIEREAGSNPEPSNREEGSRA